MEDEQIIALYWKRDDQAISQSDAKYGRYCFSIAQHILENLQDSEECVNDTWLHAWNAMPPHKPNALRMFFAKITRELSFDRFRKRQAQKRGGGEMELVLEELSECIVDESNVEDEAITRELAESVRFFCWIYPKRSEICF